MKNLAGDKNSNVEIRRELERVGLKVVERAEPLNHVEVAQSVTGDLPGFELHRNWYYWVVRGNVPLSVAEELYAHPVGRTDIRVAGHCGCPPPKEPWITWLLDDGRERAPRSGYDECVAMNKRNGWSNAFVDKLVPDDAPEAASAKPFNYYLPHNRVLHADKHYALVLRVGNASKERRPFKGVVRALEHVGA